MKALTHRQSEILGFIAGFITEHRLSPTIREIGARFKITPRAVFDHVNALERKGHLERYGTTRTARSIRLPKLVDKLCASRGNPVDAA